MKKYVFVLCISFTAMLIACSTSNVQKSETTKSQSVSTTTSVAQPMSILTTDEIQQGQSIFTSSCGSCHDIPDPKKYPMERWTGDILPDMFKKASLDSTQQKLVQGYVISQL